MRKDFLKGYLLAMLAEGEFVGLKSSSAIFARAAAMISEDLPATIGELAEQFAEQAGRPITAALIGHANAIVHDLSKRGIKAVWRDIQARVKR